MTKEVLERAKTLDDDISAINELLSVLRTTSQLRIIDDMTGRVFRFLNLDTETNRKLLIAMNVVLTERKSLLINELEEL